MCTDKKINDEENESFYEDEFAQLPPPDIIAYNELRSCADLVRMYKEKTLEIQPDFQRHAVWTPANQTRFVDSLIKQLPIPSMCFSLNYETQRWLVIDGLQRMITIINFLTKDDWVLSKLRGIDKKISGVKVSEFQSEDSDLNNFLKRVQNITLPITVIRCDHSKKSHMEYLFTIFHRLNTGGIRLSNQEIRNCIFSGPFNDQLKTLNKNPNWQHINQLNDHKNKRLKYVELILRFFSFYDDKEEYGGTLSQFLNSFMKKHRKPDDRFLREKEQIFERTVDVIRSKIFTEEAEHIGVSTLEALMFGIAKNIDSAESIDDHLLKEKFQKLKRHQSLSTNYLSGGTTRKEKVAARLETGKTIFS